jgi:hypothetical protein
MSKKKDAAQEAWTKSCIENFVNFMKYGPEDYSVDYWDLPPPRKERKPKPPSSLTSAIKEAKAAGMDVTVAPDGSVTFKSRDDNHAISTPDDELAQWRMKRANSR